MLWSPEIRPRKLPFSHHFSSRTTNTTLSPLCYLKTTFISHKPTKPLAMKITLTVTKQPINRAHPPAPFSSSTTSTEHSFPPKHRLSHDTYQMYGLRDPLRCWQASSSACHCVLASRDRGPHRSCKRRVPDSSLGWPARRPRPRSRNWPPRTIVIRRPPATWECVLRELCVVWIICMNNPFIWTPCIVNYYILK